MLALSPTSLSRSTHITKSFWSAFCVWGYLEVCFNLYDSGSALLKFVDLAFRNAFEYPPRPAALCTTAA